MTIATPATRAPSGPPAERSSARLPALDVLRGVAILLVLWAHLPAIGPDASRLERLVVATGHRIGWAGVDLFFVLSGFLVSGLLFQSYQRTGALGVGRFLIRRGFKIYPPFWIYLLFTAPIALGIAPDAGRQLARQVVFLQNYGGELPGAWGATWSLAVEEHFYLLLPLMLAVLLAYQGHLRLVPRVGVAILIAALGLRIWTATRLPFQYPTHQHPTHLRLDSLMAGVLVAYAVHADRRTFLAFADRHRRRIAMVTPLGLTPLAWPVPHPWMHTVGFTATYLSAAAVLVLAIARPAPTGVLARGSAWIGRQSYAIYLWHLPLLFLADVALRRLTGSAPYWSLVCWFVGGSVGVGALMTRLVERPALALRDRWFPSELSRPLAR